MTKIRIAIVLCLALSVLGIALSARRPSLVPAHKLGTSAVVYAEAIVPTGNGGVQVWTSTAGTQGWQDAGVGSSSGITAGTGDTTFSGSGSVTTTTVQAQSGAETFGTNGQVACSVGMTQCGFTQPNTSGAAPSAMTVQASGSTATTGAGANLILNSGLANGATSGTPGNIIEAYTAPTGTGAEGSIFFERGNVKQFIFSALPGFGGTDSAIWLSGAGPTQDLAHAAMYSNGTTTTINGASGVTLGMSNATIIGIDASANVIVGALGTGTLTLQGPVITTTQLIAHTGATLNAGQHYYFLPVTVDLAGLAVNMQLVATY